MAGYVEEATDLVLCGETSNDVSFDSLTSIEQFIPEEKGLDMVDVYCARRADEPWASDPAMSIEPVDADSSMFDSRFFCATTTENVSTASCASFCMPSSTKRPRSSDAPDAPISPDLASGGPSWPRDRLQTTF